MKKFRGAIILMVALALLASACGGGDDTAEADAAAAQAAAQAAAAAAQAAEAEAQAAEAQAQADAAAAEAAAAQAALEQAQADLESTKMAAEEGDAEAQAALEEAQMKADEAAAMAEEAAAMAQEAEMQAEEAQMALEESMMVTAPEIRAAEVAMGIYPCCADLAYWQIPIEPPSPRTSRPITTSPPPRKSFPGWSVVTAMLRRVGYLAFSELWRHSVRAFRLSTLLTSTSAMPSWWPLTARPRLLSSSWTRA
ncbi:MAG: hypothetical protein J4G11_12545 [Acidimicrobiia bacterium]|nr:hypothetical protein [Acidimicrobiia bacterium]